MKIFSTFVKRKTSHFKWLSDPHKCKSNSFIFFLHNFECDKNIQIFNILWFPRQNLGMRISSLLICFRAPAQSWLAQSSPAVTFYFFFEIGSSKTLAPLWKESSSTCWLLGCARLMPLGWFQLLPISCRLTLLLTIGLSQTLEWITWRG